MMYKIIKIMTAFIVVDVSQGMCLSLPFNTDGCSITLNEKFPAILKELLFTTL